MSEKRFDQIDGRLDKIEVTLVKQHVTLEEHVRRTDILEQKTDTFQAFLNQMKGVGVALSIFVGLCTVVSVVLELIHFFK